MMDDDAALLRQYAETRAEEAFAELVRRHVNLVYRAALRQFDGDEHRAKEATQAVFTLLARKAGALARHPSIAGWLFSTTHFTVRNQRREEWRRLRREREAYIMQSLPTEAAAAADWERLRPVLDGALQMLPERDRDLLLARFFEGRTFGELGRRLATSEDAARMRVERALEKLRTSLTRRGVTSTGAALGLMLASEAAGAVPVGLAASVTGSALGAAALASGPLAGVIHFMSMSKIAHGALALALVAAVGTVGYEVHVSRVAQEALVHAHTENEALVGRLRDLEQRSTKTAATQTPRPAARDESREAAPTEQQRIAAAAADERAAELAKGDAFLARHPELRQMYLDARRAEVAGLYAILFKQLRLSPEQIERCKDLLVRMDKEGTLPGPDGETIRFTADRGGEQAMAEIRGLLGEEGFELFQTFAEVGAKSVMLTTQVAAQLFETGAPLTANQGVALVRILNEGRVEVGGGGTKRREYHWDSILPQARQVLSDAQFEVFVGYQALDEVAQALTRARWGYARPAAPTPKH